MRRAQEKGPICDRGADAAGSRFWGADCETGDAGLNCGFCALLFRNEAFDRLDAGKSFAWQCNIGICVSVSETGLLLTLKESVRRSILCNP